MNFFEAQDDAYKRTRLLVVYFILAILAVMLSVYGIALLVMSFIGEPVSLWMPGIFTLTALGSGVLMGTGSLFKTMQLSSGGAVVARDMGARQVDPHTTDTEERQYVNIVEEMAIASGLPVPEIWIMDDELAINAFAAGTEPGNAVVAVTRGCIQRLSRDELQGVVAHEFSHILNGDMRLNMRLMGLLFGILMISMIGRMLFHTLRFMPMRSSRNDKNGGAAGIMLALFLAGIGLMIVGSLGVFFGRLIQAAISRQREFLADASAVQFTRNPDGIAGALKKIGGAQNSPEQPGSNINAPKAEEASHMFFADGGMFSYGFTTHPPLDVRIQAIDQSWDGDFVTSEIPDAAGNQAPERGYRSNKKPSTHLGFNATHEPELRSSGLSELPHRSLNPIQNMGEASLINIQQGIELKRGLAPEWIDACHDRQQAQSMIFSLLLAADSQLQRGEIEYIQKAAGANAATQAQRWHSELSKLHSSQKIALIDLSIPALRRISPPEYQRFLKITQWLIASDGQVDLFEFMLQHVVQRHLDIHFGQAQSPRIDFNNINQLFPEANVLLTTIAALGGEAQMSETYRAVVDEMAWPIQLLPPQECGLKKIESALGKFNAASPTVKQQLLRACGLAVMHDGVIESQEAELLRATADSMGCAVPPFVISQS